MDGVPSSEQIIATAATFLIEGGNFDEASLLLSCEIERIDTSRPHHVVIFVRAPRAAFDVLTEMIQDTRDGWSDWYPGPKAESIQRALDASLPFGYSLRQLESKASYVSLDPGWEGELREIARGQSVHNQAAGVKNPRIWSNRFRFRSATEVKVAEALDKARVMFFPLPLGRLSGSGNQRVNLEPDFLISDSYGNWGVLEVDGEPYHRGFAARDRRRDRLFHDHGVKLVERYEATECYNRPDEIVQDFLQRLAR